MQDLCFVTCLYDLSKYTKRIRNIDDYLAYGQDLLTSGHKIIIYTSEDLKERLLTYGPQVEIRVKPFESFRHWHNIEAIRRIRQWNPPHLIPDRITAEYIYLMWSKFEMVADVICSLPQISHFAWVDFGLAHVADICCIPTTFTLTFKWRILKYWNLKRDDVLNWDMHFSTIWSQTPGGLWLAHRDIYCQLLPNIQEIIHILLSRNQIAVDEEILTYLRVKQKDMFEVEYCTYETIWHAFFHGYTTNSWAYKMNLDILGNSTSPEDKKEYIYLLSKGCP